MCSISWRESGSQTKGFRRLEQSVDVAIQLEHPAVVGANAFKDTVAVQQAVIEHIDRCVLVPAKVPAHINRPRHFCLLCVESASWQ
jgi:acetate kinase